MILKKIYSHFLFPFIFSGFCLLTVPVMYTAAPLPAGAPPQDAIAQDDFAKILEELEQMPEEKLQELEQQLQAEVKKELEAMTPERRKEFDQEMAEFWRSQGVDPNQLPSLDDMLGLAPTAPATAPSGTPVVAAPTKKELLATDYSSSQASEIISNLIDSLESLRRKMTAYPTIARKLNAWKEAIDDLVYYLKIMDVPEHHSRMVEKEFSDLLKQLRALQRELAAAEPRFIGASEARLEPVDNPYEILRVSPDASQEEIKEAYDSYMKENDPAALRAKLTALDYDEDDIQGSVKSAQLNTRTIKEAYEKVRDPKIRAQTNKALAAVEEHSQASQEQSQGAINAILNALTNAIYQKNVLEDIQRFMKKYEPVKLEQRKKMEAAIAQRRKEQETAGKQRPTSTPGSYDAFYAPTMPSYAPAGGGNYGSYGNGGLGTGAGAASKGRYGDGLVNPKEASKPSSGSGGGSSKGDKAVEDKKADDGKNASTDKDKSKDKKDKNPAQEWKTKLDALDKEIGLLETHITGVGSPLLDTATNFTQDVANTQLDTPPVGVAIKTQAEIQTTATQLHKDLNTFLNDSKKLENAIKAAKDFEKINKKIEEDKVKIVDKDAQLKALAKKHPKAFTLLKTYAMSADLQAPKAPTKAGMLDKATGKDESKPQTMELIETLGKTPVLSLAFE